jgi:head-tail adaptor
MGNTLVAAGRLDRRVTILRGGVPTVDDYNEPVAGADAETETFASVRPVPGTERFRNAENAADAPMRFVFRWRADLVRVTDRLRFEGRIFAVASVTEIGRREGIEVLATARGEAVA